MGSHSRLHTGQLALVGLLTVVRYFRDGGLSMSWTLNLMPEESLLCGCLPSTSQTALEACITLWGEGTGVAGVAGPADPALSFADVISFRDYSGLWLSQELTPGTLVFIPGQDSTAAVSPCQGHGVGWLLQRSCTLQADPSGHSTD